MNKFVSFFRQTSPITLLLISVGLALLAKLIEMKSTDIAMGLQTITFILFVYALIKFLNSRFK